jgi:hypothetical protein
MLPPGSIIMLGQSKAVHFLCTGGLEDTITYAGAMQKIQNPFSHNLKPGCTSSKVPCTDHFTSATRVLALKVIMGL